MNKKNREFYREDDSIDLIGLLSTLWGEKKFIIKGTTFFIIIGIIYSLSLKNNYTASSVFYPHYQNDDVTQGKGIRSLAGLAGIDIGGLETSNNIPPNLYPNIISSPQFKINILNSIISLEGNELSYREYLLALNNRLNFLEFIILPIKRFIKKFKKNKLKTSDEVDNILI